MKRLKYIAAALIFPILIAGLMAGSPPAAQAQANAESSNLAFFAALMQYIRSQPTPDDVDAELLPALAQLDAVFVDIYAEGFIAPFTGETVTEAKARIQTLPAEDRYTAAMVESYRLASDTFLLDVMHILLASYYVNYFTTSDLAGANEFLGKAEIQGLADAFDHTDFAIPAPTTTPGASIPSPSARTAADVESLNLAYFAALMQYIRSQPTPTDVHAELLPALAQLDAVFVDIYAEGFIVPFTGETVTEAKARIQTLPAEDRYTAAMVESYRLASDTFLLDVMHILLASYYVNYFTTSDLAGANEFLGKAEIQGLTSAFDPASYAISMPSATEPGGTGSVETDRAALVALYNATDGPNWRNNTNWLSDMPLGEWFGVATDSDGRVSEIDLRGNRLNGQIPPELGNLTRLQMLKLESGALTGSIPPELGKLVNLRDLQLDHNQLTGAMPQQLFGLARLEILELDYNELSGSIPPQLGSLTNLRALELGSNMLSGPIPSDVGKLTSLERLHLFSNQLSGPIPPEMGNLSNLRYLILSRNQLSGTIPAEMTGLTELEIFNFHRNRLLCAPVDEAMQAWLRGLDGWSGSSCAPADSAADKAALETLYTATGGGNWADSAGWLSEQPLREWHGVTTDADGRITGLHMESNNLSGSMPSELGSLARLKNMNLGDNDLSGPIPPSLGNLTSLEGMWLYDNRLSGAIPSDLGDLSSLRTLNLSTNGLTGSIPSDLGNLSSLQNLYLNANDLSGMLPQELTNLTELRYFYFDGNPQLCASDDEPIQTWLEGLDFWWGNSCAALEDRAALVTLYNATGGDNWSTSTNWLSDRPLWEWHGVGTDEEGRVSGLWLGENGLSGPIPPELGKLSKLTNLSLWNNQLSSEIPEELGQLTNLQNLHLGDNELIGPIPPELGKLTNLEGLSVGSNELSGSIPSELGKLTSLEGLWLYRNNLSGSIPPELGNLTNLSRLLLDGNELSGSIPSDLGKVTSLELLALSWNELSGPVPPELGNLTNLQRLWLNNNGLSGALPQELTKLTELERFYFADNPDLCAPTDDAFEMWLQGIDDWSGNSCAVADDRAVLVTLYNAAGGANWSTSTDWLSDKPMGDWYGVDTGRDGRVTGLWLGGNGLNGSIPSELGGLPRLEALALDSNSLSGHIPGALGDLTNLEYLYLWGNDLSGQIPPELGNLTSLRRLILNNNQLNGEIPRELGSLSSLETLNLWNNDLGGPIPPELGNLSNLQSLYIDGNRLSGILPLDLTKLSSLREFNFHNNPDLCAPEEQAIQAWLQGLDSWYGNSCAVADDRAALVALYNATDGDNWSDNTNWLSDEPIGHWHGVETSRNGRVTRLWLGVNDLNGEIPSELGNLADLEYLDLDGNELSGPIPSRLGELVNLQRLNLSGNDLSGSIPSDLGELVNLQRLYLSGNDLSGSIPSDLGKLANLERLYLSYNELSGAVPSELGNLGKLERIEVHYNRLSGTLPKELTQLTALERFRFHGNRNLCAPVDGTLQTWLLGIEVVEGSSCAPADSSDDRAVLVELYEGTDGTNWRDGTNWLSDQPLRTWHGVTTDANGRVTGLYLGGNRLDGAIPTSLGDLSGLRRLYLWNNDLNGSIPGGLGDLSSLKELDLWNNDLTGQIPASLGSMTSLTRLVLGHNRLSGSIPASLGNLANLRGLYLNDNDLTGPIPSSLGDLANLIWLRLNDNDLSGDVPSELGKLTSLEQLYLTDNQLTGCVPEALMDVGDNDFDDLGLPFCS